MRLYDIVPVAVELVAHNSNVFHFLVGDFASGWILPAIQATSDSKPLGRGCFGNQIDDSLVVTQRFTAPVRGNEGEEPVLDLVPLARAGRKMTDRE